MKIDILVGENEYGTTPHFAKGLGKALEALGTSVRIFWVGEGHFFHAFYALSNDPPDLTCSFSDISLNQQPLGELWNIPHLTLLIDPPIYFLHQLTTKNAWVSCADYQDTEFVRQLGFAKTFCLPHATDRDLFTPVDQKRPYDIVFFGTCVDFEQIAQDWQSKDKELLYEASKRVLTSQSVSILQTLVELGVQELELPRLYSEVYQYTRGKERIELIRALKKYKVHVFGAGPWERFVPDAHVHASIDFIQSIAIMQQSKVVLDSAPRFKAGCHERVFYALMCGASIYTAETLFTQEYLPEILTYRFGEWDFNLEGWKLEAKKGQQQVLKQHTYHERAQTILSVITQSSMF